VILAIEDRLSFTKAKGLDTKLGILYKKLEAELQAFFCLSVASYNFVIGEAYYFLVMQRSKADWYYGFTLSGA